ncbi:MAG: sterol desaturase family protein [Cytophagales bacterium]|nr:MAG: sterol desaturase [Rhodothermaeota bacterium MED-G16]
MPTYYITTLNIAIPFFISLILIEIILSKVYRKDYVMRSMDTLSSLCSGLTNIIKDVLGLTFIIISYGYMVEHFALFKLEPSIMVYVIAFIGIDFAGYWVHRINHNINYFWNHHIIHHSSEEFNLACALRQSISNFFSISFIFLIPTAIIGVPPEVIAILAPLHLFAQYWYHTRLIGKLGLLEYIIVTPSHHRVHHAINNEYLDKNLSQVFIIWDKLFGTFQEELDGVPPVYGVKRPLRSWNPILINFSHLFQLIKDAWRTNNILDKFRIWFMPTGWRPQDVILKYPLSVIESPYEYKKYYPNLSENLKLWSWVQFGIIFLFIMYYINHLHLLLFRDAILFAIFLFMCIYSLTSLMDKENNSWIFELIKASFGISLIAFSSNWTFMNNYIINADYIIMTYFILSLFIVLYFNTQEIQLKSNS